MAALTAGAAWPSYLHGLFIVREVGNTGNVAYDLPLLPDGLIGVSTVALIEAAQKKVSRPPWATAGLALGIILTTAQNVASGYPHGAGAMLVNGLIPLILIIALEILVWSSRLGRDMRMPYAYAHDVSHDQAEDTPSTDDALRVLMATNSRRKLAGDLGVTPYRVEAWAKRLAEPAMSLNGDAAGAA